METPGNPVDENDLINMRPPLNKPSTSKGRSVFDVLGQISEDVLILQQQQIEVVTSINSQQMICLQENHKQLSEDILNEVNNSSKSLRDLC